MTAADEQHSDPLAAGEDDDRARWTEARVDDGLFEPFKFQRNSRLVPDLPEQLNVAQIGATAFAE